MFGIPLAFDKDKKDKKNKMAGDNENVVVVTGNVGRCPEWGEEKFEDFLFLFENFVDLNKVDIPKQVGLLINSMGVKFLQIKKLLPTDRTEWNIEKIKAAGKKLWGSAINKYAARDELTNRLQNQGEGVAEYAVALQTLCESCEYTSADNQDGILKGRFLAGLNSQDFKFKLYGSADNKTFAQVVDDALMLETLKRSVQKTNSQVHKVNTGEGDKKSKSSGGVKSKTHQASTSDGGNQKKNVKCFNCGRFGHYKSECRCCFKCKQYGHKSSNCKQSNQGHEAKADKKQPVKNIIGNQSRADEDELFINNLKIKSKFEKIYLPISFLGPKFDKKGSVHEFEVDTGSVLTIIGTKIWRQIGSPTLRDPPEGVCSASGHALNLKGAFSPVMAIGGRNANIECLVTEEAHFGALLGTRALDQLVPNWRRGFMDGSCNNIASYQAFLEQARKKFSNVFSDNGKPVTGIKVGLRLKPGAEPILKKPYTVPPALAGKIKAELDRMVQEDILYPVDETEWASAMVAVKKKDGSIRLCMDPSQTINLALISDHFPLPKIDDLMMKFSGKKIFSTIDLKGAYQQLGVDKESQKLLTMNTPFGLFRFKRLPFGISPAPSIFQKTMMKIFEDMELVIYLDDIIVAADNEQEMKTILNKMFERMSKFNLRINYEKSKFFLNKVKFLGHIVSDKGIEPDREKIKAMLETAAPTSVKELQSFIGLVEYYSKFLPRINERLEPLFKLLKKNNKWIWSEKEQKCFEEVRAAIENAQILCHYDSDKDLILSCDASDKGICGVLCHLIDGVEKPILFFSRTLIPAERNYPILHRECLAVVYSLEKTFHYTYGKKITVFTDHKPLLGIIGKKPWPAVVISRLQRYQIRAAVFEFELKYRKGTANVLADFGSRHPMEEPASKVDLAEGARSQINSLNFDKPLNLKWVEAETKKDEMLAQLYTYIESGWPSDIPRDFNHWYKAREKLSIENGCVLFEGRVWMPRALRRKALEVLHINHSGIVKMKIMARDHLFWPNLSKDIENFVMSCETCMSTKKKAQKKEYSPWPKTQRPWERIHADFFHFAGKTFLLIVDDYTKWLECKQMTSTDASNVIAVLELIFEMFGDPETLVADNGPPFNSKQIREFLEARDVKYLNSPPYHPESNGLAERHVRTVKSYLKKVLVENEELGRKEPWVRVINKFLSHYRNTPRTGDLLSPAERIFAFVPRIGLRKLSAPKYDPNSSTSPPSTYQENEIVWYRDSLDPIRNRTKAQIVRKITNFIYLVRVGTKIVKTHINQLSKYIFRHKLYDAIGAKLAYDLAGHSFEVGREELSEAETKRAERSKRNRRKPERFQPEFFKTRRHGRSRRPTTV